MDRRIDLLGDAVREGVSDLDSEKRVGNEAAIGDRGEPELPLRLPRPSGAGKVLLKGTF